MKTSTSQMSIFPHFEDLPLFTPTVEFIEAPEAPADPDLYGDAVYASTRRQAVADGEQMLLAGEFASIARDAGYVYPVYLTSSVVTLVEMAVANKKHCNDWAGVLHDILFTSRHAGRAVNAQTTAFRVIITGTGRKKYHNLIIQCGPTDIDDPAPCLTIMHPDEL